MKSQTHLRRLAALAVAAATLASVGCGANPTSGPAVDNHDETRTADTVQVTVNGATRTVSKDEARRIEAAQDELNQLRPGEYVTEDIFYTVVGEPRKDPAFSAPLQHQELRAGSNRFTVPALNASVRIIKSGVTDTDFMDNPGGVRQIGWLATGMRPNADRGVTVFAGHRDTGGGSRGVRSPLYDIGTLKSGELIGVTWNGVTKTYRITHREHTPKSAPLPDSIMESTGEHRLVYITCAGPLRMGANGELAWSTRQLTWATEVAR